MKRNTLVIALAGTLSGVLGLSSCNGLLSSFGGEPQELESVSDLAEHVRSVHVESEVSKERLRSAVAAFISLTDPGFRGDPQEAFETFVVAIETSEKQSNVLRKRIDPMLGSAQNFFEDWASDLDAIENASLRKRSKDRMIETHKLYKRIERAVDPVLSYSEQINMRLQDYATYLSNDFNADSVASLERDVRSLNQLAIKLDQRFEICLGATSEYVGQTGMYGQAAETEGMVSSRD